MKPDIQKKLQDSNPMKVKELQLDNGRLNTIPFELKNFKKLKSLTLFNNKLSALPDFFSEFRNLENLNLSNNEFMLFPEAICELDIKYLNLKSNKINDLQGLEKLSNSLWKLDLSSNKLEILRFDFTQFELLTDVDLSDNQISKFPKSLIKPNLKVLKLSSNKIKELPKNINDFEKIHHLDLSYNQITELPDEICELVNLRTLNLTGNKIIKLPKSFSKLTKLNELYLNGNPIGEVPLEISKQGLKAVLNYYLYSGSTVKLNEAKILLVGQGGVGKTHLINKLIYDENPVTLTTEGIDILKWNIGLQEIEKLKESKLRLNVWDFGGQEIYHSTHQFFLTKRSVYLFIWEARTDESLITFDYWLNIIKVLSNSSPVIVIQNKIDERIKEIDEKSLKEKFTNIIAFKNVSAKTSENIENLKNCIQETIINLPHINDKLPKVWTQIREKLEILEDNYISFEKYIEICNSFGLNKEQSKSISQYYHDLGVFLHFVENAVLKPHVFLKPEWATNCVYKILDLKEVIKNYGEFDLEILESNLEDYTTQQITLIVELMKKFELCFELTKGKYIIPELLKPTAPEFKYEFQESITLIYKYDFMPAGIAPRLTVRLKDLIDNKNYWKNGVFLRYQQSTLARIESNQFTRIIRIEVDGPSKAFLLEKIKYELDTINETLNNPYFEIMIKCNCSVCSKTDLPYMFNYEFLQRAKSAKKETVECQTSLTSIDLSNLIGPYQIKNKDFESDFAFNYENLTNDILEIGTRILERKYTAKLEDLITDIFVDHLRSKGYQITDQTRSGIAKIHPGELDIMVRNIRNMPISIVEALKITSIGLGNTTVIDHINKLFLNYDTNGLTRNFILVYCKTNEFTKTWLNYNDYLKNLHMHRNYHPDNKLIDISINNELSFRSNLKIVITKHEVRGSLRELYHILLNMD